MSRLSPDPSEIRIVSPEEHAERKARLRATTHIVPALPPTPEEEPAEVLPAPPAPVLSPSVLPTPPKLIQPPVRKPRAGNELGNKLKEAEKKRVSRIIEVIASLHGKDSAWLLDRGHPKLHPSYSARLMTVYIINKIAGVRLPIAEVGRCLGGRQHADILNNTRVAAKRLAEDAIYRKLMEEIVLPRLRRENLLSSE